MEINRGMDIDRVGLGIPDWKSTLFNLARHKFAGTLIDSRDEVLILGCGEYWTAEIISEFTKGKIVCVDADGDVFSKYSDRFITHESDAINFLTECETKFDVVISMDFIEHFSRESGSEIVEGVYGVLREQGLAIFSTPRKNLDRMKVNKRHVYEYEPREFRELFEERFGRMFMFSQTDETISTEYPEYAWNLIIVAVKGRCI